jgi:hypothetical protein
MATTKPPGKRRAPSKTPKAPAKAAVKSRRASDPKQQRSTGTSANAGQPRKLQPSPQRDKEAPAPRRLQHEQESVTLEEVLVNFQRSLARATRSSLETARADLQVGMGQRALYVIDGVEVKLQAGVVMARDTTGAIQAVSLDLGAPPEGPGQAELRFRIASRPIDPIAEEQIVLADLDPLGLQRPSHRLRVTLIGHRLAADDPVKAPEAPPPQGPQPMAGLESTRATDSATDPTQSPRIFSPLPGCELHLYLVGTTTGATEIFILKTNAVGQADIEIDARTNSITSGEMGGQFQSLDLTRKDSEFFAWATCDPKMADGITEKMTSNVLQFTVKRDSMKGENT